MTSTIESAFNLNQIIDAISQISVTEMRSLYRKASSFLLRIDADETQADINEDARWWANDAKDRKYWRQAQNVNDAVLMTVRVVTTVQATMQKSATVLHTSPETLEWSQMGGHHLIDGRAADAWLRANISTLV